MTLSTRAILALLGAASLNASAASVDVGGAAYALQFADFTPVEVPYAGRTAVVAYETVLDVDGDFGQTLNYRVNGSVFTKWFAGNLAVSLSVNCYSLNFDAPMFIGEDLDFGIRYDRESYQAKPNVDVNLSTGGNCHKLKVRIDKEGHLSRQYYTQVTDLDFQVQVFESF